MSGLLTATLMESIVEDLDWLGTHLGGMTIMPYVSHSVYGGQPWLLCQACPWATRTRTAGITGFNGRPPSPLRFDTHDFAPKDLATRWTGNYMWFSRYTGVSPEGQGPDSISLFTPFNDMLRSGAV